MNAAVRLPKRVPTTAPSPACGAKTSHRQQEPGFGRRVAKRRGKGLMEMARSAGRAHASGGSASAQRIIEVRPEPRIKTGLCFRPPCKDITTLAMLDYPTSVGVVMAKRDSRKAVVVFWWRILGYSVATYCASWQ